MNSREFQEKLGYSFNDVSLLKRALTHRSYTMEKNEGADKDNERLEFLGDAFFNAIIGEELYRRMDNALEGTLTKYRAHVVCEKSLALRGRSLGVGEEIIISKGEEFSGGRNKDALIADALESVIGAVFLDGGYEAAKIMVLNLFKDRIEEALAGKMKSDYKTVLQEKFHAIGESRIYYILNRDEGPDHNKVFYIDLFCVDRKIGTGRGRSKKEAEQNAAKDALERGVGFCTLKE